MREQFTEPGPFRAELQPGVGKFAGIIAHYLPDTAYNEVKISRMAWEDSSVNTTKSGVEPDSRTLPDWTYDYLPTNIRERIEDWMLFGKPIFSSPSSFLFGHPPMDRSVRTSAHNYYIDLTYNFGVIGLLPIMILIAYTARLLWQRRRDVLASNRLLWLAILVAFFIIIDSNFKVTLRQPYPGIFAFFLWGLLLARLRTPGAERHINNGGKR
jgi:hypothetical protein